ncbi:hypothetical protein [Thioclava sp.]|uniref:hypothetical protein n=1 Tax=Thioclava sp. TaxID=1933450 RepID=UPI003242710C
MTYTLGIRENPRPFPEQFLQVLFFGCPEARLSLETHPRLNPAPDQKDTDA